MFWVLVVVVEDERVQEKSGRRVGRQAQTMLMPCSTIDHVVVGMVE